MSQSSVPGSAEVEATADGSGPTHAPAAGVEFEQPGASSPEEALALVLGVLDVQPDPGAPTDANGATDHFHGTSYRPPWGRIFGGQVLAQSLVAAAKTVEPDRPVHSLHAYFLRPGDPGVPIEFAVDRLRDGRSFTARRTHALQNGLPILSMIASFQTPSEGIDHQLQMPDVPDPESLPGLDELYERGRKDSDDDAALRRMLHSRPVDLRPVETPVSLRPAPEDSVQAVWMRASGPMPAQTLPHTALLAFASDYTLLGSALRRHDLTWTTEGMKTASLDHAMWFHRPVRMDDWVLYVQGSPSASGARGLGLGWMFSRDGRLVASTAQEGMIRVPRSALG